ncbi:MAG: hypothetical protein ACRDQA_02810 [Nocardioidaceae bacterium]
MTHIDPPPEYAQWCPSCGEHMAESVRLRRMVATADEPEGGLMDEHTAGEISEVLLNLTWTITRARKAAKHVDDTEVGATLADLAHNLAIEKQQLLQATYYDVTKEWT